MWANPTSGSSGRKGLVGSDSMTRVSRNNYSSGGDQAFFYALIKKKDAKVQTLRQAQRFIEAIDSFPDKAELLNKLDDSRTYGPIRIHDVLAFIADNQLVETLLIPLLRNVLDEKTSRPLYRRLRNRVLMNIYSVPALLETLVFFETAPNLTNSSATVLCQFLLEISRAFVEPKESENVKELAVQLRQRGDVSDVKQLCFILCVDRELKHLEYALSKHRSNPVAWGTDFDPPGNRHNNDFFNFRNIRIFPTLDEILCETPSYLPFASGANDVIEDPEQRLLDSNFRLLREDAIRMMKQKIYGEGVRVWNNARIVDLHYRGNTRSNEAICSLSFMIQFSEREGRSIDWERSRALSFGSLVALCRSCSPVRLGKISLREAKTKDAWLNAPGGPIIGVTFQSKADFVSSFRELEVNSSRNQELCNSLESLKTNCGNPRENLPSIHRLLDQMETYDLIEVSQSFCTSEPILRSLQLMDQVPLSLELVDNVRVLLDYLPRILRLPDDKSFKGLQCNVNSWNSDLISKSTSLDFSQAEALKHALSTRVALIQGPPGTGKTFIGGAIAQIIRENTNETILCVCYTNHALDQFLEHMLDAGETRLVRIGGRSRSERIKPYRLQELSRRHQKNEIVTSVIRSLDARLHGLHTTMETHIQTLREPVEWESPNGGIQSILQLEYRDYWRFLCIPELMDGFSLVGKRNQAISRSYLFDSWKNGEPLPAWLEPYITDASNELEWFWSLSISDRRAFLEEWTKKLLRDEVDELFSVLNEYNELMDEKQTIMRSRDTEILNYARVIGVTTTGAAQYRELLNEKAAHVLIVEEAGEVLEAHVLSALNVATKHLVLIGDHKQLRPKTESYELTVGADLGYALDLSMFERLVSSSLPSASLQVQHRMRPEISDFVRSQTYPLLKDHESVLNRPNIKGSTMNVSFIHHDVAEDGHDDSDHSSHSKSNKYEAEICVEIVRYLLLQGYKPGDIVVLTPYVGQLVQLTNLMRRNLKEVKAFVSESDAAALDQLDIDDSLAGDVNHDDSPSEDVRCSSIDNFQGEEADIVVVSLVRSNGRGIIGFLKEPQRVNVLLSRARNGMFLVGNKNTLSLKSGRPVWNPILDILDQRGQICEGFPSVCQLHPEDGPIILRSAQDFRSFRPNGGCDRPCRFRMRCGHACLKACHPVDQAHLVGEKECCQPCRRFPPECTYHHACQKLCYEECGSCQYLVGPVDLPCGHVVNRVRCHDVRNVNALEKLASRCLEVIQFEFSPCGHVCPSSCANVRLKKPKCPSFCSVALECGHPCQNDCGTCDYAHACKVTCDRTLFCSHRCGKSCHGQEKCKPCNQDCERACSHSSCPRKCWEPCSPCVESCEWECEHKGRCPLVCAAPCSRLPCDMRCSRLLPCGHQCPSVCGEICPPVDYCQVCGSRQSDVPDMLMLQPYDSIDLNNDPIIILRCNHFFTCSTLDGHFEMESLYEREETGEVTGCRTLLHSNISDRPLCCPVCRLPIQSVNRYGRPQKYSEIRALERKHMQAINMMLESAQNVARERRVELLVKVERQIHRSPLRMLSEELASLGFNHVPRPPSVQHIEILYQLAEAHRSMITRSDDTSFNESVRYYKSSIMVAAESLSIYSNARSRFRLASLIAAWASYNEETMTEINTILRWIFEQNHIHEWKAEASSLLEQLQNDKQRIAEVVAAMNVRSGYDYGTSPSAHWFECPNGHPYFIGECGGASELSKCPECGEEIGGERHNLLSSNRRVRGTVAEVLGVSHS